MENILKDNLNYQPHLAPRTCEGGGFAKGKAGGRK